MKIKQLKEKTAQGLKDFLPKIGVGDIEGLLDTLNDKLSKSQGGEIKKPIVITTTNSEYSLTINPDGSIYIWYKKDKINIFSIVPFVSSTIIKANDVSISGINSLTSIYQQSSPIYYAYNDTFTASKFKLRGGTNNQVLLGDGSTTSKLVSYISTSPQFDAYIVNILNIDGAHDSFTIPGATKELAGLMTATDKVKLDDIPNKYAEKSKTISNITISHILNKRGLYMAIDYADRTNPGTILNIPNVTTTLDGCMSHEDKNKLDNIENTYISSQNGNIYSQYNVNNGDTILDISGNYDEESSGGKIRLRSTEDGKGKISIVLDGADGSIGAEKFMAISNQNGNEVWCTNGNRLNVINLLKNAAIYVDGTTGLAEGGLDNTTVVNAPDSIIFDQSRKRFLARKDLTYYTHWNANIARNIAPPSRYGIETNIGVYPFNNQLYKFSELDGLYTAICFNGTCSMNKLTINKE
nr:MAG TPA: hypothetical protein [Crassvirales sp.]